MLAIDPAPATCTSEQGCSATQRATSWHPPTCTARPSRSTTSDRWRACAATCRSRSWGRPAAVFADRRAGYSADSAAPFLPRQQGGLYIVSTRSPRHVHACQHVCRHGARHAGRAGGVRRSLAGHGSVQSNDVWYSSSQGSQWSQVVVNGGYTSESYGPATCVDVNQQVLYIVGGDLSDDTGGTNAIWYSVDLGQTWLNVAGGFPGRANAVCYVDSSSRLVVIGGKLANANGVAVSNDVWVGTPSSCRPLRPPRSPGLSRPPPRRSRPATARWAPRTTPPTAAGRVLRDGRLSSTRTPWRSPRTTEWAAARCGRRRPGRHVEADQRQPAPAPLSRRLRGHQGRRAGGAGRRQRSAHHQRRRQPGRLVPAQRHVGVAGRRLHVGPVLVAGVPQRVRQPLARSHAAMAERTRSSRSTPAPATYTSEPACSATAAGNAGAHRRVPLVHLLLQHRPGGGAVRQPAHPRCWHRPPRRPLVRQQRVAVYAVLLPAGQPGVPLVVRRVSSPSVRPHAAHHLAGTAVQIVSGTGTRTFTNKFGQSRSTCRRCSAGQPAAGSSRQPAVPDQRAAVRRQRHHARLLRRDVPLPGHGPSVPYSTLRYYAQTPSLLSHAAPTPPARTSPRTRRLASTLPAPPSCRPCRLQEQHAGRRQRQHRRRVVHHVPAPITFANGARNPVNPSNNNGGKSISLQLLRVGRRHVQHHRQPRPHRQLARRQRGRAGQPVPDHHRRVGHPHVRVPAHRRHRRLHRVRQSPTARTPTPTSASTRSRCWAPAPASTRINTAPFVDYDGIEFSISPGAPAAGLAPGAGTLYNATSVYTEARELSPVLVDGYFSPSAGFQVSGPTGVPVLAYQQQSYVVLA